MGLNRAVTDSDELHVPDSDEDLRQLEQRLTDATYGEATLTDRARWRQQASRLRVVERMRADERTPTVQALADRFGWSPQLTWHLVQPYCYCGISADGWVWCRHAADERVDAG
jgi:hypothetical protein